MHASVGNHCAASLHTLFTALCVNTPCLQDEELAQLDPTTMLQGAVNSCMVPIACLKPHLLIENQKRGQESYANFTNYADQRAWRRSRK